MSEKANTLVAGAYNDGTYLMPPFFGGLPYPLPPALYGDTTNLSFSYNTDGEALARMLPPGFELLEAKLLISVINNRQVDWLAGGAYNLLAVNVPVRFKGEDEEIEGIFGLVVWENATAPILMGRDVQGVPKIYGEIDNLREFPPNLVNATAHLNGFRFAHVSAQLNAAGSEEELAEVRKEFSRKNWFGWRHFPNVGAPGAALSHPVIFPQEFDIWSARLGTANVQWHIPDWISNPTQIGIITALSSLPNLGGGEAVMMRCSNTLRADLARIPT